MIPTLQLYDTAHNKLCGLTNYSDLYVEQALGTSTTPIVLDQLHFKYALEDERNQLIKLQCFIATEDAEYIVKEINLQTAEGGTSGPTWVEYVCDLNVTPLKSETIDNFAPGSTTADASANLALAGTGWSVGYCDVTKRRTAVGTNCSPFDCLSDIAKAYSCDVAFDTTHKLVNLHQQQGADRGAYLAEDLNLKTLQVQSNSRDYCTRLYPIGKDGMTIADVNDGVPYVSNYQYSTEVIVKKWVDNRYTVAADLLADAQDRLAYLSKPTRAYSADIIDLARVSDEWGLLDFAIGDTITLLSYSTGVREQQRIVKVDRYLDEPEKTTCEISNKIASLDDIVLRVSDAADAIDAATDSTGAIMGSSVQITNPDGSYSTLTAAVATVGELIATKATITDLQAATARITTLEATSVTTDYLTANYLTADSIQATYATIDNLNAATARISTLESSQITTDYLAAHYAEIDLSNIGTGVIQTAMIATGAVQTAQIADGSITDAKIVGLTANKITAGTIDASKITVTNLNCANLTVGTINGQQIASGAIDTSKLTSSLNSTISTAASNASSALTAASTAQTTANGKNTAYYQSSTPSGGTYKANDIWYDTDDGYKMYYYSGSAWTAAALGNDAIATLDAGKITTGYLAAARIAASTITGTMIAGTTITAANIATNTITAAQIAAGTITATQIASRTITADRIVAGAITANEIASHTITATQIAANTITAGQIAAGTITATQIASGTITSSQINVTNLINALNVSTQTLYAQRITTSGGAVYGTIGNVTYTDPIGTSQTRAGQIINKASDNTSLYGVLFDSALSETHVYSKGNLYVESGRCSFEIGTNLFGVGTITYDKGVINLGVYSSSAYDNGGFYVQDMVSAILIKLICNGTDGIELQKGTTPSTIFRVDTSGSVTAHGNVTWGANQYFKLIDGSNNLLIRNGYTGSGSIYLMSDGGVNVTNEANSAFVSVTAAGFTNVSLADYKQGISKVTASMRDAVRAADIVQYWYNGDNMATDKPLYGCAIGGGYNVPDQIISRDGKGINQYSMTAVLYKAVQEDMDITDQHTNEIALLNAQIAALQARVTTLEAAA